MSLTADLAALRAEPGVHLATLHKVDAVLTKYAGQRLTVLRGAARVKRLQQAAALIRPNAKRPGAIRCIVEGLGVSPSSARRYFAELQKGGA